MAKAQPDDYEVLTLRAKRDDDMRPYQIAFDASGYTPVVTADWTVSAKIKAFATDASTVDTFAVVLSVDPDDADVVVATLGLAAAKTALLARDVYGWDLQTVAPDGTRWTPTGGPLLVSGDVTR